MAKYDMYLGSTLVQRLGTNGEPIYSLVKDTKGFDPSTLYDVITVCGDGRLTLAPSLENAPLTYATVDDLCGHNGI